MFRIHPLLAAGCLIAAASAQTLVIPAADAAVDGPSSTSYPFDVANGRFLYVYDSSHFTANGVTFPIRISQIALRANAGTVTWTGTSMSLQLDLSTAPFDYTAISTTWNANHGADRATVFNGTFAIGAGASTAGVPGPFYAVIPLAQPFQYDPLLGDLAIDLTVLGNTPANLPTLDADNAAGTANAKRVYSVSNPPAATATLWSGDIANVLQFTYTPVAGLFAGFDANVTGGASPLQVTFTDRSFSSDPAGVTGWAWDLDGDSVVDSTLQNPSFVYGLCGSYSPSLTVFDASHAPATVARPNYIVTDRIAADFTWQLIASGVVQFTDASSMPATTWAWDLDGDSVVDSTAQNPAFVYATTVPVNVTLTVTRLCSPPSTIVHSVAAAQSLSHNMTTNNGLSSGATVFLDANVLNPAGVAISSMDVFGSAAATPFTVDVWLTPGSYQGLERVPAAWTRVATASGTSTTTTTPSLVTFPTPLYLPAGTYGIGLQYIGVGPRYNGTASSGPLVTFGNGDLTLTIGAALSSTATAPFTGTSLFSPRLWSGTMYYGTHNITNAAGLGFFAPGCAGSSGTSHLTGSRPQLGGTLQLSLDNLPLSAALLALGFSNTGSVFGPLPLDLGPFGAPGCLARVSPDLQLLLLGSANAATLGVPVPNLPALNGMRLYGQAFVPDPAANAFGIVTSDAVGMIVGN